MACFLAPAAEAVVTTVLQKKLDQKEKEAEHGSVEHIEKSHSLYTIGLYLRNRT